MKRTYIIWIGSLIILLAIGLTYLILRADRSHAFERSAREMLTYLQQHDRSLLAQELPAFQAEQGAQLVDLRAPEAFRMNAPEGAINLPLNQVLDPEAQQLWRGHVPVVLIDEDGRRAVQAWMLLTQMGYQQLYVLEGGLQAWQLARQADTALLPDEAARHDFQAIMEP